ncbi:restriction endonuclease [Streptantibioticus ferralitis]|uniref:Restriction endonuclease n=1 Tax=Streptantibioticus ferralitis TaxID=236510 RepID=A0ABT5YRZ7_9ACTN|nr:restriction endonuclease [Streptantibioticus ferralitis]MDF2254366.1 restriction endonuclease [Streptantibioticus ferralitis]
MTTESTRTQQIHPAAYGALVEALASIYWYKKDLAKFIRHRVTDFPELLVGLDFDGYKRTVADEFVDRLMEGDSRYRELALDLMVEISEMDSFPGLKRNPDSNRLIGLAREAVADLKKWTEQYRGALQERQAVERATADYRARTAARQSFSGELERLKERFLEVGSMPNRQEAGRLFEIFLNELFQLFDLDPRLSYKLATEQIDGSLSFDTDDYIIEAKWHKGAMEREALDIFDQKVKRKGRNALGLYIAVNGFTAGALREYNRCTSFITLDGGDLFCVLDGRIHLDELLKRKKRHANETGNCYFPVHQVIE